MISKLLKYIAVTIATVFVIGAMGYGDYLEDPESVIGDLDTFIEDIKDNALSILN